MIEKRKLKHLANRIAKLERKIRLGKDVKNAQSEIENIMCRLSYEEVLYIDGYIEKNKMV